MGKGSRGHVTISLTKDELVWLEIISHDDGGSPKPGSVSSFASSIVKRYIASVRRDLYNDREGGDR